MHRKFSEPGRDGDLDTSVNIWKKGIVYTRKARSVETGYRLSVAFKRGVSPAHPLTGFQDLYSRVISIGTRRVAELISVEEHLAGTASIVCQGWRLLGEGGRLASLDEDGKIATAFVTLELRTAESASDGERQPSDEDLNTPGGTSLEDLIRVAPQLAAEVYNEFDFSDTTDDPVTVSFGERIAAGEDGFLDFGPSVERAEAFTRSYYGMLASLGEVGSPLRIVRREWFLADPGFVTVHVCFSQQDAVARRQGATDLASAGRRRISRATPSAWINPTAGQISSSGVSRQAVLRRITSPYGWAREVRLKDGNARASDSYLAPALALGTFSS
jgi:hypothetical protein